MIYEKLAYPPVVFYSYVPGANRTGVQALGYEGSPKVSPSIPLNNGSLSKRNSVSIVSTGMNMNTSIPSKVY